MATTEHKTRNAGVYLRISSADDDLGVRRQEAVCRKMATDLGWEIVGVPYEDNNRSAWSGKSRPAYQRMLEDLRGGRIDAVLAFAADRLIRNGSDRVEFLRLAAQTGFVCHTYVGGPLDMATAGGRFTASVQADVAEYESNVKSERARAKMAELRTSGKFPGGRRAFGLSERRRELVPEEAALVRQAAEDVLAGRRLYSIVQQWNDAGVRTANGNFWNNTKLKDILLRPWARGLTTDGTPATWPALIDKATARRLDLLLRDPARRRTRPEQRRYLLTSLMVCGLCGGRLGHGTNNWKSSYRCPQCHRCHVIAADAEEDIAGRVLARIDQVRLGELAVAGTAASADEEALALLEAKADELVDMLGAGDLDRAEYRRARERLEGRTEVVKSRIRRDLEVERRRGLVGGAMQLASTWDEMSTDDKREIIKVFVDHITLRSAVRGRNTYDPSRLVVTWV